MDICRFCKKTYPLEELYLEKRKNGPGIYRCRSCNTKIAKKYRSTESGKERVREAVKRYEMKNKKRLSAWRIARYIKKRSCVKCGNENSHKHHPDINKPLEVIFLCPQHHKEAHKKMLNAL